MGAAAPSPADQSEETIRDIAINSSSARAAAFLQLATVPVTLSLAFVHVTDSHAESLVQVPHLGQALV